MLGLREVFQEKFGIRITNNYAEGFNYKMGAKKTISKQPNPYALVDEIITQLKN